MKVLIVGGGEIGARLAETLIKRKWNQVTLVELDEERARELADRLDALVIHGDGTHPEILKKARVTEMDALAACTGADSTNTVVAMLGKRFGLELMVVRLEDVGLRAACQEIGVTRIVAPEISAAAEMASTLSGYRHLDLSLLAQGGLELAQLSGEGVTGERLGDLAMPEGTLLVAVVRGEEALFPRPAVRLEEGDDLLVLAEDDKALGKARAALRLEGG